MPFLANGFYMLFVVNLKNGVLHVIDGRKKNADQREEVVKIAYAVVSLNNLSECIVCTSVKTITYVH